MAGPGASLDRDRRPPAFGASSNKLRLGAAAYRVVGRMLRAMPAGLRYSAMAPGGTAWYWLSAAQRRAALDNYAAALDRKDSDPAVARVARRAFQNYGRMLSDFVLMGSLTPDDLIRQMTVEGLEHVDAALAQGRGAIMAVPHMGSWDMGGSWAAAKGYSVSAVAERFPGSLNDAVVETRQRFGLNVIVLGRPAVRAITEALRRNGIVALLCDLEQGPGVNVRFFGRRAVVPGGPAAIAIKTGAALLPSYVHGVGPSRYHIHLDPPLSVAAAETKESLMQRVVSRFEDFIKERPDQWYAFRPMFRA